MRRRVATIVVGVLLALLVAPAGVAAQGGDTDAAGGESRTLVFRLRTAGLVAGAAWTTCPAPVAGDVCTETTVFAFDTKDREGKERMRTPVLRVLTFVFRVVDDEEVPTKPVAEWFGRLEGAQVDGDPRLERATAQGVLPVQVCTIFEPEAGFSCPESLDVSVDWTAVAARQRIDDHLVFRLPPGTGKPIRMENSWTRGWRREATAAATINGVAPGSLLEAEILRVDQGEIIVQHPFD